MEALGRPPETNFGKSPRGGLRKFAGLACPPTGGEQALDQISSRQLLTIWLALAWRSALTGFVGGGVAGFAVGLVGTLLQFSHQQLVPFEAVAGWCVGWVASVWALKAALMKKYKSFRLSLITNAVDAF